MKTEIELHKKTKEISLRVLENLQINNVSIATINKIKNSLNNLTSENRKELEIVLNQLETDIETKTLKEFDMAFRNLHIGFNTNLLTKYPDLTGRELRICAFTRLNLNTKEISVLTNQSVSSIDTARFRLKQKLGLSKNENIIAFLMQF